MQVQSQGAPRFGDTGTATPARCITRHPGRRAITACVLCHVSANPRTHHHVPQDTQSSTQPLTRYPPASGRLWPACPLSARRPPQPPRTNADEDVPTRCARHPVSRPCLCHHLYPLPSPYRRPLAPALPRHPATLHPPPLPPLFLPADPQPTSRLRDALRHHVQEHHRQQSRVAKALCRLSAKVRAEPR